MNEKNRIIEKDITSFPVAPHISDYEEAYKTVSWKDAEWMVDFFPDNTLNAAYNAVDRHANGDKRNKVAIKFVPTDGKTQQITYNELKKQTNQFANVLTKYGVKKGDRVFVFLPTIPERFVVFLGILKTGAIAGTMFAAFQEMALMDRLKDSQAKIVVTDPVLYPRIANIWKDLPDLEKVIIVDTKVQSSEKNNRIISYAEEMQRASEEFTVAHMQKDDFAYMLYTSGTTGKPKGVVHAHYDILQAMVTTKYVLDLHDEDVYWCTADLGWVTGVVYGVLGPFCLGGTTVAYEGRFSPENWYTVLQNEKVTVWYTAPTAI